MIELQDIFIQYEKEYRKIYNLTIYQKKALEAIKNCRTSYYGAHLDICEE